MEIRESNNSNQNLVSDKKRVFYNGNQIQHMTIEFKRPDVDGNDEIFVSEYPEVLNDVLPEENVSEARIDEAQHFLEISIINDKNNVIKIRKIPYNSIIEIDMCTMDRKCEHGAGIKNLSESEKNSLK